MKRPSSSSGAGRSGEPGRERLLLERLGSTRGREAWPTRLALAELWLGRPERAPDLLSLLRAAVQEEPLHAEAWGALSEVCQAQGLRQEALDALERAGATAARSSERAGRWAQLAALRRQDLVPGPASAPVQAPLRPRATADLTGKDVVAFVRGDLAVSGAPEQGAAATRARWARKLEKGRSALEEAPLEPRGYRTLGRLYASVGDVPRSNLMMEIADALESKGPERSASRLPLRPEELAGLRHPALRQPAGELLSLAGPVLIQLVPRPASVSGAPPFEPDVSPGAEAVAHALRLAAQVLGVPELEPSVVRTGRAILELRFEGELGLGVRRDALETVLSKGLLRFQAGAALFSQHWDLAVLRLLGPDALEEGLSRLRRGLSQERSLPQGARTVVETLPRAERARLEELLQELREPLDLRALRTAARASAHRAGLVVAGSVGPGLEALRLASAGSEAQVRLVRFAASERFFQLRHRSRAQGTFADKASESPRD